MNKNNAHFNNVVMADWQWLTPDDVMTSASMEEQLGELYQRLKLNPGRLEMMTGVRERRHWPNGTLPGEISAQVARPILIRHPQLHSQLDLLINASVCRDQLEPATAARVHARLELSSSCAFFDLSNACLGVVQAMALASSLIEADSMRSVLIVAAENSGPLLRSTLARLQQAGISKKDMRPLMANLTIGSGAVAILLRHRDEADVARQGGWAIRSATSRTRSQAFHLCHGGGDINQLEMFTDSEALLHEGIALARETWQASGVNASSLHSYLTHQVGSAHSQLLASELGLVDVATYETFPYLGNTGPVALPMTLMHYLEKNNDQIPAAARMALLGIGSGLSSTILSLEKLT